MESGQLSALTALFASAGLWPSHYGCSNTPLLHCSNSPFLRNLPGMKRPALANGPCEKADQIRSGCAGGLGLRRLNRFRRLGRQIDPLQNSRFSSVTLALAETDNARVTTMTLHLLGSDLVEENLYGIFLMQTSRSQAAMVNG